MTIKFQKQIHSLLALGALFIAMSLMSASDAQAAPWSKSGFANYTNNQARNICRNDKRRDPTTTCRVPTDAMTESRCGPVLTKRIKWIVTFSTTCYLRYIEVPADKFSHVVLWACKYHVSGTIIGGKIGFCLGLSHVPAPSGFINWRTSGFVR